MNDYSLDAAINLRGKTWLEAGYEQFCTPQERHKVISFHDSIEFSSEPYMDIPDYYMAVPCHIGVARQTYTKKVWKQVWREYRKCSKSFNF